MKDQTKDKYSPVYFDDDASEFGQSSNADSLYVDKKYNINRKKQLFSNIQITNLKTVHNVAFILFCIVFLALCIDFFPSFLRVQPLKELIESKKEHLYFSTVFAKLSGLLKFIALTSYFYFFIMVFFLTTLIRQRCSVPELINQKYMNWITITSSLTSLVCLICLLYYQQPALILSQNCLGLVENVCFPLFLINCYIFSISSYITLAKIKQACNKQDEVKLFYFNTKQFLVLIQTLLMCCYLLCEIFISFCNPVSKSELLILAILIKLISINCVFFFCSFLLYVLTLSFDYSFINLHLQVMPDIEYFIDFEEPSKLVF